MRDQELNFEGVERQPLRAFTENAPKPRNSTRSPRDRASMISSKTVLTIFSTWRCVRCGLASAIFWISSERIIRNFPPEKARPVLGRFTLSMS